MLLLEKPRVEARAERFGRFDRQPAVRAAQRTRPPRQSLGDALKSAGEFTLGVFLGLMSYAVCFLLLAGVILSFPFVPFLLPLLLAPAVVLVGLMIVGAGKVLAAVGLAPPPPL